MSRGLRFACFARASAALHAASPCSASRGGSTEDGREIEAGGQRTVLAQGLKLRPNTV